MAVPPRGSEAMRPDLEPIVHRVLLVEPGAVVARLAPHRDPELGRQRLAHLARVAHLFLGQAPRRIPRGRIPGAYEVPGERIDCLLELFGAHFDDLGDGAASARAERDEGRLAMARRAATALVREVARRIAAAHDRLAVARRAAAAKDLIVRIV